MTNERMTNEEAVRMLKAKLECMTRDVSGTDYNCNHLLCDECRLNYEQGDMGEQKEYTRMSIEALKQQPCEDAISRQAAIKYLCTNMNWYDEDGEIADDEEKLNAITDLVNGVPPVTPQRKMGHWIYSKAVNTSEIIWSECSECKDGERGCAKRMKYCPNCGAKMEAEE